MGRVEAGANEKMSKCIHSFIQHAFIEYLQCASVVLSAGSTAVTKMDNVPPSLT